MAISERQLLDAVSRTPLVDSTELAGLVGEPHTRVRTKGLELSLRIKDRQAKVRRRFCLPYTLVAPKRHDLAIEMAVARITGCQPHLKYGAIYRPCRPIREGSNLSFGPS